jgi:GNAT superfamily N-acetyltransferase
MIVRPIEPTDFDAWAALHRAFVNLPQSPETMARIVSRTWAWLMDPGHVMEGAVAQNTDGRLVGYALFRACPSPQHPQDICFMDSLYVMPEARRQGAGTALTQAVIDTARARGWMLVRWLARQDNAKARGVYERVAGPPSHIVYGVNPKEA